MVRLAHSITRHLIFVDSREYTSVRRKESEKALGFLGVRGVHLGLHDAKLHTPPMVATISSAIEALVIRYGITTLVTLGMDGYCGHQDHVATHKAALVARHKLERVHNIRLSVLAINKSHEGSISVPVDSKTKLASLAHHKTNFLTQKVDGEDVIEPVFLAELKKRYGPLFEHETYDIV